MTKKLYKLTHEDIAKKFTTNCQKRNRIMVLERQLIYADTGKHIYTKKSSNKFNYWNPDYKVDIKKRSIRKEIKILNELLGNIGISVNTDGFLPISDDESDNQTKQTDNKKLSNIGFLPISDDES